MVIIKYNNKTINESKQKFKALRIIIVFLFFGVLSYAVILDGLPQAGSDPRGTTVASQNILDYHDIFILHGPLASFFKSSTSYAYQVQVKHGHVYYYFPVGTPILITPLVYIENLFGVETYKNNNDSKVQKVAVMGITFLLLIFTYLISRRFFSSVQSAGLSALTFFGSLVGPTVGTGLWSIDFDVLFTSIVVLMLLQISFEERRNSFITGTFLGLIFFFGFLVRPTFAIIIIFTFIFLYIRNKKILIYSAATSGTLLALFMAYCHIEIGSILPPYYLLSRLSTENAFHAFYGLLFSPSRSIFVFTPALLLIPYLYLQRSNRSLSFLTNILAIIISALFFINVFFPHWDAGWSYGPRILAGMSYIGILSLIIIIGSIENHKEKRAFFMFLSTLLFVGCLIDVNGMYNPYTLEWNAYPNSDSYTNYVVWNTDYPQFLMNKQMLIDKCYSQTKYLGINSNICFSIGSPYPGSKYFSSYAKHYYNQFYSLFSASPCYVKKHHSISGITPYRAEKDNCLSKKYGGFPSPLKNDNWTNYGGWLGVWNNNHIAVGIIGKYPVIKNIIKKYKNRSQEIYFPYPSKFNDKINNKNKSGQLLIVFK